MRIHPTAIIEDGAQIGADCEIGAYAYIGPQVRLGNGCRVHHHAAIEGVTHLGDHNEVFPHALLGARSQDKKWNGEHSTTRIGDHNIFREFTTLHPATFASASTIVGCHNLFCAYSHIGHESHIGSHVVFSNNATLGGHVSIGDRVVIGGLTAVHQFCTIGSGAMLGGCCKVVQDVMPWMLADGFPATHRTINKVGMQRAGFNADEIQVAARIYRLFFRRGLNHSQALQLLKDGELGNSPLVRDTIAFVETASRGLA
jgi:UDP-N-acetylglucosamine acyltransferase